MTDKTLIQADAVAEQPQSTLRGLRAALSPQPPSPRSCRFSRFDRVVLAVALVILAGIGLTILLGDQVGVTLVRVGPLGTGRSTSSVIVQFSEPMNRDTVAERLRLEPAVQ